VPRSRRPPSSVPRSHHRRPCLRATDCPRQLGAASPPCVGATGSPARPPPTYPLPPPVKVFVSATRSPPVLGLQVPPPPANLLLQKIEKKPLYEWIAPAVGEFSVIHEWIICAKFVNEPKTFICLNWWILLYLSCINLFINNLDVWILVVPLSKKK
jgi:hypothetical protein